jgi:hypothetical protein
MHLSSRMCSPIRSASVASFSDFERVIPGIEIVIPGIYLILFRHWHMTLSDVVWREGVRQLFFSIRMM